MGDKCANTQIIYLIGSLRNAAIPSIGNRIRDCGFEVFDDWHSAGPEADDHFKRYHIERNITYDQALKGYAAQHIFNFDKRHLDRADMAILVMPAGRSGHLELGYMAGRGKPTFVLLEEGNDRRDLMLQFANGVYFSMEKLLESLLIWKNERSAQLQLPFIHGGCTSPSEPRPYSLQPGRPGYWEVWGANI